jgi:hypothetical protein
VAKAERGEVVPEIVTYHDTVAEERVHLLRYLGSEGGAAEVL